MGGIDRQESAAREAEAEGMTMPAKRKRPKPVKKPVLPDSTGTPIRDAGGKFVQGHPGMGGRPPGSREGQKRLCQQLDDLVSSVVTSGKLVKALEALLSKGDAGTLAFMKLFGWDYSRKGFDQEAPPSQVTIVRIGLPRTSDDDKDDG